MAEETATTPARRQLQRLLEWPDWPRPLVDLFDDGGLLRIEERREDDDALLVRAEIPGLDPEHDVEITVADGRLRIHAEKRTRTELGEGDRSEFRYGSFERVLTLPSGADADAASATYADGVLEVRVPVSEERSDGRRIPVSSG